MSEKLTPEILAELKSRLNDEHNESELRKWFMEKTGLKKSRSNEIFNNIKKNLGNINQYGLEFVSDRYVYNEENDTYIVNLKNHAKPLVINGAKHRAICRSYSDWDGGLTAIEICRKYSLTPEVFSEYKSIFKLDKSKEPLSAEEVFSESVEKNVAQILEEKRYKIFQQYEKESWKITQRDAIKWRHFQAKVLDPFSIFLDSWTPPKYEKIKLDLKKKTDNKSILINVADIHVGAKADARYLYRSHKWNINNLISAMEDYAAKIVNIVDDRKLGFEQAVITIGGDIIHTLTGYTDKGTKLEYEFIEEDQIDFAFNILVLFISNMLSIFPKVSVKSVSGNHSSLGDYIVSKMLQIYFKDEARINFDISSKRYLPFKVNNSLFILDHGASPKGIKSKLPRRGPSRNSYIQGILLAHPELLQGINQKYFITNDKHHFEYEEHTDFEMILCPSIVGGDRYSDLLGLKSRPSQCIFMIDDTGIAEIIKIYFDNKIVDQEEIDLINDLKKVVKFAKKG